jgi:hypothetical protein
MLRPLRLASAALFLLAACSDNASVPFDAGTPSTGNAVTPANAAFCGVAAPPNCNNVAVCGVCVPNPTKDATRTTDSKEYKGTGPVDASCFSATPTPVGPSKTVKMKGWVKIFANGPDSKGVTVEIFEEEVDAAGVPTGKLGKLVGSTKSMDTAPACGATPTFPCSKSEEKVKSGVTSTRTLYPFELDGIPTEKPLIAKTSGDTSGWFPLYDYNVAARNDKLNAAGEFEFDVRALGNDDYASILKAAYNQPPQGGEAAIAGEVHDCGDVRVGGATVAVSPAPRYPLFYLSEVEDDPLPDSARKFTGKLGLYAVGGIKPGVFTVSSAAKLGADVVTLGSYKVQTFADSVTVFTFRGLRPWQVVKK